VAGWAGRIPPSLAYPATMPMMTADRKKKLLLRRISGGVGLSHMATVS
jgi:hypothetical protein